MKKVIVYDQDKHSQDEVMEVWETIKSSIDGQVMPVPDWWRADVQVIEFGDRYETQE